MNEPSPRSTSGRRWAANPSASSGVNDPVIASVGVGASGFWAEWAKVSQRCDGTRRGDTIAGADERDIVRAGDGFDVVDGRGGDDE